MFDKVISGKDIQDYALHIISLCESWMYAGPITRNLIVSNVEKQLRMIELRVLMDNERRYKTMPSFTFKEVEDLDIAAVKSILISEGWILPDNVTDQHARLMLDHALVMGHIDENCIHIKKVKGA